jgi:hypothetical protein
MIDVREQILARLLEVVSGLPAIRTAYRNNGDITEDQLPAAIVFDGDEESQHANNPDLSQHPPGTRSSVQMTPEIIIAERSLGQVGSELSGLRRELIKGVLFDTQLNEIVGTGRLGNGAIRYLGCQTNIGWMRTLHGALRAQFMFKYWLKPDEL